MEEVRRVISGGGQYQFPGVAVTSYLTLGGFKQQKHILLQCWRPEAQGQGVAQVNFWKFRGNIQFHACILASTG